MIKCIITEMLSDSQECIFMETAESWFSNGRFAKVMKGMDEYFVGEIVSSDTPLGYVEENTSLFPTDEYPHMIQDL